MDARKSDATQRPAAGSALTMAIALVLAGTPCAGCSKSPAPQATPAHGAAAAPAAAEASTAAGAGAAGGAAPLAVPAAAAATPSAAGSAPPSAPAMATATAAVDAAAPPEDDGISLHVGKPGSEAFALPERGRPARLRVTPVDGAGRPIEALADLDPLTAGVAPVLALAWRQDLAFAAAWAPVRVERGAAVFDVSFPLPGPHHVLFAHQRVGKRPSFDRASLRVQGTWASEEPPANATTWSASGLSASLEPAEGWVACEPVALRLQLTRSGRAIAVDPQQVQWLALPVEAQDRLLSSTPAATGPATLIFDANVTFALIARTRVGGAWIQPRFQIRVGGSVPVGGCAALQATGG